ARSPYGTAARSVGDGGERRRELTPDHLPALLERGSPAGAELADDVQPPAVRRAGVPRPGRLLAGVAHLDADAAGAADHAEHRLSPAVHERVGDQLGDDEQDVLTAAPVAPRGHGVLGDLPGDGDAAHLLGEVAFHDVCVQARAHLSTFALVRFDFETQPFRRSWSGCGTGVWCIRISRAGPRAGR